MKKHTTSENQLASRAKYTLVTGFLQSIAPVLNKSYSKLFTGKSGVMAVAQQILRDAVFGSYPQFEIDPSKVRLIRGEIAAPMGTMTYVAGSNELDFCWSECSLCNCNGSDELFAIIYCSELNEFWHDLNLGIRRDEEFCTIQIPEPFVGSEIHVWLAYRSSDQRSYSDSRYMGQVKESRLGKRAVSLSCERGTGSDELWVMSSEL